jgi:hypothetical protein
LEPTELFFEIKGDSMPPLQSGSIVIGEYVERIADLKDGQTYVVISKNDGIVYKRIFNQVEEEGTLILRSDNPTYTPYPIPVQDVLEIWKGVVQISHVNKGSDTSFQNILDTHARIEAGNSGVEEIAVNLYCLTNLVKSVFPVRKVNLMK